MERQHSSILKKVRSQLPRRESERRVHHLARHCDILSAIETRINMLDMTFLKYIEVGACCFIPGKVIDEILQILKMVESTDSPPRVHEVSIIYTFLPKLSQPTPPQNYFIVTSAPSDLLNIPSQ